ncbi:c-type cytochrome [Bacillus solitudinis]|uniref:c-type cytochrome n=1 Tax=Bacillus solitudinis TaxID=2014074 RepID=UPI000C24928A|nr:c-type cytochrome [Bacillus solitudinis]
MKKFLIAIGAVFALTACGGGDTEPAPEEVPAEDAASEEATGDFDAASARETYESTCIGCHGGNLEGVSGPPLAEGDLTSDEILEVIQNGKGAMAPQAHLSVEDAENLAKWIEVQ